MVTNTKGGVGKTTTAIYLACALSSRGSVEVWDLDAQGSATEWAYRAEEAGEALPFEVRPLNSAQLRRASSAADFVVVDTAPGDARGIDAALALADVAVLPTGPASMDMDRLWETEKVASQRAPAYVLLTLADRRTRSAEDALSVLEEQEVGYFETVIPLLSSFRNAYGHRPGETLEGYESVTTELLEAMQW